MEDIYLLLSIRISVTLLTITVLLAAEMDRKVRKPMSHFILLVVLVGLIAVFVLLVLLVALVMTFLQWVQAAVDTVA